MSHHKPASHGLPSGTGALPMRPAGLHGSCGARGEVGVLLLGRPGAGKSDLLLRLIDRGFMLVADDHVVIEAGRAAPAAALAGLIEVRGLGLLRMSYVSSVPLVLVLALDDASAGEAVPFPCHEAGEARLPHPTRHRTLGLPMLRVEPFAASAAFRVELALDCLAGRRSLTAGALEASVPS